ncbi:hypothetical protein XA68_13527 [Ophiocordyceps unilateralis]|uniref:Chromo domain-containing protein n=1 Tax=Ophiocordyceps unilateralis TaxID=268505 RepID=A0A2A9PNK8_OPHUN|nr:hypothetical protein XA68_13527 [Ophiocordyceps unilateralis]
MSLSQMASVFIGRETMVRLDEVDGVHPGIEDVVDQDELPGWEFIEGNENYAGYCETDTENSEKDVGNDGKDAQDVTMDVNESASDRLDMRRASSRAASGPKDKPVVSTGRIEKKRGRPKGSKTQTPDNRGKGTRRRSGRIRSAPEHFAPEPKKAESKKAESKNAESRKAESKEVESKKNKPKKAERQRRVTTKANKKPGNEWEIERIVDDLVEKDTLRHFYLVQWKGFDSKDNTWEPKTNMANCSKAIMAYEKKTKAKKGKGN